MIVLAADTSSLAASCALWEDGTVLSEFYCNTGLTHSQTVMPMINAMLSCARVSLPEVGRFAVSVGPGSFTGLRIGMSTIKAMALAAGKPCAGVSTLHGLAANIRGFEGIVIPVMDARRGQVYTAFFESRANVICRMSEDSALTIDELKSRISEFTGQKILVGDGARLCMCELEGCPDLTIAPPHVLHQRAANIAEIAAGMAETHLVSAGDLSPSYLRLPQAEREHSD